MAWVNIGAAFQQYMFVSDELDLTTIADVPFGGNLPPLPGYKFIGFTYRMMLTNIAATTFSGNPSISFGNDASFLNLFTAAGVPSAAAVNSYLASGNGGPYAGSAYTTTLSVLKMPDMGTRPTVRIATGITGTSVTSCKGRLVILTGLTTVATI